MIFLLVSSLPLLISLVIIIVLYKRLRPKWIRAFTWYMLFTQIIAIVGYQYSARFKESNHFIFNSYLLVEFLFFFCIFYKSFQTKRLKKLTVALAIGFLIFTILSFLSVFAKDGFYVFNSPVYMVGSLITIIMCLLFFVSLFKSEGIINYFQIPMFWIATGILFYFVGNFIYLGFIDYIIANNLDKDGAIYRFITFTLSLLLYSLFTIGFLSNQTLKTKT
ncbi:MAG TPA: hypothetical protein VN726_20565 [Hanamia sp.]|nr:hypothetical protein [Hanamia sp.]